ncbi:cytochrome P460 [Arachidicoccus ginsenosidimutans]|uniref:cytochrome P460 family protein n=1 Tax=Arachidicoccus sp. BS20 TaxID=1850526 RepID=UPI0007F08AF1|nr:cytochrome P460 family protein [Arachidicoccus sp. BS20]ANI89278.1 cytochrome P460 [Arachidicoccus sp. BS20]
MSILKSKKTKTIIGVLLLVFIAIQFVRPSITYSSEKKKLDVPDNVEAIIRKSCYDCHSDETNLKWFDKVQPAYWLVAGHIKDGRKALNFSRWDSLSSGDKKNDLYLSLNQILYKTMPLPSYLALHHGAKLDSNDITVLKNYLLSISPSKVSDTSLVNSSNKEYQNWINGSGTVTDNVKPTLNGIEYIKGFENWKAISTSDRFDNGTMRVIFGNDIAVKAIASGNINPYPDGTVFAKAAWKEQTDSSGMVYAGQFFQVEFMIKDSKKYASTEGWGWARWRGTDLKPYGKTALFVTECTSCHQPMKDNDFVFTMPLHLSDK